MSVHHSIIRVPLVSEKSMEGREDNKYSFKVAKSATKDEIKEAISALFDVEVVSINTVVCKGKVKRQGRYSGKRADWKKAIVKLKDGQTITQLGDL